VFFSHNRSANGTFSHDFSAKRLGQKCNTFRNKVQGEPVTDEASQLLLAPMLIYACSPYGHIE
jgi:hypothetical protein